MSDARAKKLKDSERALSFSLLDPSKPYHFDFLPIPHPTHYHRPLILFSSLLSSASLDSVADGGRVRPPTSRRAVEEADRSATVGGYVKVTCTDETYDGEEVHGGECCHWWVVDEAVISDDGCLLPAKTM
ncbi:unnamed protein product [Urochloa humidicola]